MSFQSADKIKGRIVVPTGALPLDSLLSGGLELGLTYLLYGDKITCDILLRIAIHAQLTVCKIDRDRAEERLLKSIRSTGTETNVEQVTVFLSFSSFQGRHGCLFYENLSSYNLYLFGVRLDTLAGMDLSLKVTFRSIQELDDFLESRFRRLLLEGMESEEESATSSKQLNVMNEVRGMVLLKS